MGGAEAGGAQAEKVMRSAFTVLDDNLVHLRAQYAQALPSYHPCLYESDRHAGRYI